MVGVAKQVSRAIRTPLQKGALHLYGGGVRVASAFLPRLRHNPGTRWLFVACLPNGGSTALAKMLGSSRSAVRLTPSGEGQWLVPAMSATGRRWDPDLPLDYAQIRRVWLSRVPAGRDCVVVEKSPPNLCRFRTLTAAFSEMPTLALVMSRDPVAVCASWAKRYAPSTVIRTWHPELAGQGLERDDIAFHEALGRICGRRFEMLRDAADIPGAIVTTYEDVARDPEALRDRLADALPQLSDIDPRVSLGVKDYPEQSFRDMNAADIARLSSDQANAIRRGLAPHDAALRHFGYTSTSTPA
ncbi:hypothetical protein [Citreimonas sp.]|uniref:hypothetical protein n=1 Tax=Citreimonas sp. TaxID=3036715 RepID=UPI0035C7CA7B